MLTRQIHLKILQSPVPRHCVLPRTSHDSLRRREVRLARVSMAIVLLYLVCHTPKLVPSLCEILYGDPKVGAVIIQALVTSLSALSARPSHHRGLPPADLPQLQPQLPHLLPGLGVQPPHRDLGPGQVAPLLLAHLEPVEDSEQLLVPVQQADHAELLGTHQPSVSTQHI